MAVPELLTLGDFTFMKTQRILGILWLALCCIATIQMARLLSRVVGAPHFTPQADFFAALLLCLAYIVGAVASIFLFWGAHWARICVGLVASMTLIFAVVQNVRGQPLSVLGCAIDFIALVSVVLLFWPRHEPVA